MRCTYMPELTWILFLRILDEIEVVRVAFVSRGRLYEAGGSAAQRNPVE